MSKTERARIMELEACVVGMQKSKHRLSAALAPFAKIALTQDCADTNLAGIDALDMPDFSITPAQVRAARAALSASSGSGK